MINIDRVNDHLKKSFLDENNTDAGLRRSNEVARVALNKLLSTCSVEEAIRSLNLDMEMTRVMSTSFLAGAMEQDAADWLGSRRSIYEMPTEVK